MRFWAKVKVGQPNECWPWLASTMQDYGVINIRGKTQLAHVMSLQIKLGRDLLEWSIHTCDNHNCCNPSHLYEGDHTQNIRDAFGRFRLRRVGKKGSSNIKSVFRDEDVATIRLRAQTEPKKDIALSYGVALSTIYKICARDYYK